MNWFLTLYKYKDVIIVVKQYKLEQWFCVVRLSWAGNNLQFEMHLYYELCPWYRIDRSTYWPAVQRATTVPRMPQLFYDLNTWIRYTKQTKHWNEQILKNFMCAINLNLEIRGGLHPMNKFTLIFTIEHAFKSTGCITKKFTK